MKEDWLILIQHIKQLSNIFKGFVTKIEYYVRLIVHLDNYTQTVTHTILNFSVKWLYIQVYYK